MNSLAKRISVAFTALLVILSVMLASCSYVPADISIDASAYFDSHFSGVSEPSVSSAPASSVAASSSAAVSSEAASSSEPAAESSEESSEAPASSETSSVVPPVMTAEEYAGFMRETYSGITNSSLKKDDTDLYFDKSVFVGNSIILHFNNYITGTGWLGECKFFASGSFSAYTDLYTKVSSTSTHPSFRGEKMTVENAVPVMEVETVYLQAMALNDVGLYTDGTGAESTANNLIKIIKGIKKLSPDVNIVVMGSNCCVKGFQRTYLNNNAISKLNILMLEYCNENGYDFIDLSSALMTDDGYLKDEFCTDNVSGGCGCHLTTDAFAIWVTQLREYAYAKQAGTWKNPTVLPLYNVLVDR